MTLAPDLTNAILPKLKVRFDEPEHGRIWLLVFADDEKIIHKDASHIYSSFDQLVTALGAMLDVREERLVVWLEAPAELEMRFSRRDDVIWLEITSFDGSKRPHKEPEFTFYGSYNEICLPFWRALRALEGRYSVEELEHRWRDPFPHRELALLTQRLAKD
ncbi:hypothetical protein IAD21_03231 [Abditibacteriota bacterium]|nr:hypothetical protein IAD21_03231 [Abditibacteriota bacterium]